MELIRLTAADYDPLIALLNDVFGRKKGAAADFERDLPIMCVRDDAHMGRHFGIREDGRLCAVLGVYPLPVRIAGIPLLFSTVGNVATHWEYEGRGYMSLLMEQAMKELDRLGADASRLGGLRQRYNRYGYETCGVSYLFTLTGHNVQRCFPDFYSDLRFSRLERENLPGLAQAHALYSAGGIAVDRSAGGYEDVYRSMAAWQNEPWLALRPDGSIAGYLCASSSGTALAEQGAVSDACLIEMLCQWQRQTGQAISLRLAPWQPSLLRRLSALCEGMSAASPCHFQIRSWAKVLDALMKLKAEYLPLPEGELVLSISGYGSVRLYVKNGDAGCEPTGQPGALVLDRLTAARYLFGPLPPHCTVSAPSQTERLAAQWLPLPLSWNLQDRV